MAAEQESKAGETLDPKQEELSHEEIVEVTKPGRPHQTREPVLRNLTGAALLSNSWLNRGTSFTAEERRLKKLEGLLPPNQETLQLQSERVLEQLEAKNLVPLNQFNILKEILSTNQTLFYKVLIDNIQKLAPIVYTPTVGEACIRFDHIYREPSGIYLSAFHNRGRFAELLRNWPSKAVQIIVLTDGSRILGLGDIGTNGMGIPIGKIALFVAAGGFHPEHSLPLCLDVGTNNKDLLQDKFYMGEKQQRLDGKAYWEAIDEVCDAVKSLWPDALLQFEDFESSKAFAILERRRSKQLCFNDDIQGTAAVVVAGIINGLKIQKTSPSEVKILFFGAGAAAVGVAEGIAAYFESEAGLSREQARKAIFLVDSKGLVYESRGDELPLHKKLFARTDIDLEEIGVMEAGGAGGSGESTKNNIREALKDLKSIVSIVKPHALIGLSAAGPSWNQEVVEELCKHVEHPCIFPLSNPTNKAEITAAEAVKWSKGAAIFASGSPFDPVEMPSKPFKKKESGSSSSSASSSSESEEEKQGKKVMIPAQANNVFIFPGIGFGAVMCKAKSVSESMFTAAAKALAGRVSEKELKMGQLYPKMETLCEISATVAAAVAKEAWESGISGLEEAPPQDWLAYIKEKMWSPDDDQGVSNASEAADQPEE